jgi:hypothetical protein
VVAVFNGVLFHRLWGADQPLRFPDQGAIPAAPLYFPSIGGFRLGLFTLPPGGTGVSTEEIDHSGVALRELDKQRPGLSPYLEPNAPRMHTTATVDIDMVLSAEVILELDNGSVTTLRAGDTVVQNGTRHRWRNEGPTPATVASFIYGAHHDRLGR